MTFVTVAPALLHPFCLRMKRRTDATNNYDPHLRDTDCGVFQKVGNISSNSPYLSYSVSYRPEQLGSRRAVFGVSTCPIPRELISIRAHILCYPGITDWTTGPAALMDPSNSHPERSFQKMSCQRFDPVTNLSHNRVRVRAFCRCKGT